jgi:hypothetical protein
LAAGEPRLVKAIRWPSLFTLAALLVVSTKIAFEAWGIGIGALDFTGISGHAMTATSVLAVAGYLLGSKLTRAGATSLALAQRLRNKPSVRSFVRCGRFLRVLAAKPES